MRLIHPMEVKQEEKEDHLAEIGRRFKAAVSSIGYGAAEQERLNKKFDTISKIITIVSLKTQEERKRCLLKAMERLKMEHSIVDLLFLARRDKVVPL